MFKYSAPSTHPVVAPEFHGIPEVPKEQDEVATVRPDTSPVHSPPASEPRLLGLRAGEDGDLMIPEILRKPPDTPPGQLSANARSGLLDRNLHLLSVATASAAGFLFFLVGGLMIYAADGSAEKDVGAVPVKTISLKAPPPSDATRNTSPAPQIRAQVQAPARTQALDKTGFEQRFNSVSAADTHRDAPRIKSQDRLAQISREGAETERGTNGVRAASHQGGASNIPVLGYAAVSNPHAGWDEGQRAISSAAGKTSSKSTRVVTETPVESRSETRTKIASAQPDTAPPAAQLSANIVDPGQMTETSTVTVDVNLRGKAEKDAPVLAVVPKDTMVSVGSCDRWWCAVEFNGQTGFVGKKFVEGKS